MPEVHETPSAMSRRLYVLSLVIAICLAGVTVAAAQEVTTFPLERANEALEALRSGRRPYVPKKAIGLRPPFCRRDTLRGMPPRCRAPVISI